MCSEVGGKTLRGVKPRCRLSSVRGVVAFSTTFAINTELKLTVWLGCVKCCPAKGKHHFRASFPRLLVKANLYYAYYTSNFKKMTFLIILGSSIKRRLKEVMLHLMTNAKRNKTKKEEEENYRWIEIGRPDR